MLSSTSAAMQGLRKFAVAVPCAATKKLAHLLQAGFYVMLQWAVTA